MAVGSALGILMPNYWFLVIIGIISHFFLDNIPHWQEEMDSNYVPTKKTFIRILIDVPLGLLFVWWVVTLFPEYTSFIIFGTFIQFLPDFIDLLRYLPKRFNGFILWYIKWHDSIQNEPRGVFGIITQLFTILLAAVVVIGNSGL
ncbi:MAG: hypothetical protein ABIE68_02140 [bacterium]